MSDAVRWSAHVASDDPSGSLLDALYALEAAHPRPDAVIVVDNAPSGRPRPEIEWSDIRWLRNPRPQSHGRCHNQAVELALHASAAETAETIALLLTPDVVVAPDLLRELRRLFEADARLACVGPVVYRAHVAGSLDGERRELERTDVIDAAGISLSWLGRSKPITDARAAFAPAPSCFAVRLSALRVLSPRGPWLRETGSWEDAAMGLFRGLRAAGYGLAVARDARAWRLAARDGSR
ncbi:hypothetical protein EDM68_00455 [Candidatus Uhrbacteria bacterium]|nr:MAG: hypothetical protein EDM68_00455 [Candidatus Uhrbacteria bacterium]